MTNDEAVAVVLLDLLGRIPTAHEVAVIAAVMSALGIDPDAEVDRKVLP